MSSPSAASEKEDFATAFKNSVHHGLDMVLGPSSAQAILNFTEMTQDFLAPGEVHDKFLGLFGQEGAISLEKSITKDLVTRLKGSLDLLNTEGTFDFDAAISAAEKGASL